MGLARATLRLVAITLVTLGHYLAWLVTRVTVPFSAELGQRTHHAVATNWARWMLAILGVEVACEGEPPRPPFFLVCNHLSYVDIPLLLSRVDGVFLAKSEVASWPVMGHLASVTGTLFVDRRRKSDLVRVVEAVKRVLDSGWGIIVFPEGTSSGGESVLPFKSSLFEVAVQAECPVFHASVTYESSSPSPPARLSVCWWGDMGFVSHFLRLLTLPSVSAGITFGPEPVAGGDRKSLCARAHEAVQRHFTPVPGGGESEVLT